MSTQVGEDSDDDLGGGTDALFSEKQIPEWAQYYPDYPRLKKVVEELAGGQWQAPRTHPDIKRHSSDSAERVAAAGSSEVEFRTMLDTELSRVNQFVVKTGAELRQQVDDLERDSRDMTKNTDELRASVHRCMTNLMQLDDFSSLCQAIFLRMLSEHDAVSDVPMLLQYSQKLYYQPFLQSKCADLAGPLAAIESVIEARAKTGLEQKSADGGGAALGAESKGLDEPLLGGGARRQSRVVEKKPMSARVKAFFGGVLGGGKEKSAAAAAGPMKLTPPKIEPKVYFANERTFLHWMHMCVTLGAVAMAIMAEGAEEPSLALPGLVLTALSAIFILYAWYLFMWRAEALKAKIDHLDDRVGPSFFVVAVLGAMAFVGYRKIQHALDHAEDMAG